VWMKNILDPCKGETPEDSPKHFHGRKGESALQKKFYKKSGKSTPPVTERGPLRRRGRGTISGICVTKLEIKKTSTTFS